jgi:hypothetical protein
MHPRQPRIRQPTRWRQFTSRQEHFLKRVLIEEAQRVGPSVALLVQALWAEAVVDAAREVYQLLRLPRRYGVQRLEAACKRAAYYRRDRNHFTIEWILQKRYDELPLTHYTDIRGHFIFACEDFDPDPRRDA